MKSTLSSILIVCLVATAFPVSARETDWSRVIAIAPGTDVSVRARGVLIGDQRFVSANESTLTILTLTGAPLPKAAKDLLRDIATRHPEYFADVESAREFNSKDVHVSRDGVFVDGRKLVGLEELLTTVARNDVSEIRGSWMTGHGWKGGAVGAAVGAGVGLLIGFSLNARLDCDCSGQGTLTTAAILGIPAAAGLIGYLAGRGNKSTRRVIYRAPSSGTLPALGS